MRLPISSQAPTPLRLRAHPRVLCIQDTTVLQINDGRYKVHPIADWTDRDVYRYLKGHDLPYHPLWERGYVSVGDWHSTDPLRPGMSAEQTRFFGLKRECALHE